MSQVTCLQIFKYDKVSNKFWAFKMMQFAHSHLNDVNGLTFYKLMGSGRGLGFNPFPDWSTYALLTVWENEEKANLFFDNAELFKLYKSRALSIKTHYMKCIKSHGEWAKQNPFEIEKRDDKPSLPIGVITRATIKKRHLFKFWNYVPQSTIGLKSNSDLIYTKGIGEIPIIQMATFSIWKNEEAIKQYAYKNSHHNKAITLTRKHNWYDEEMFSRFQIIKTTELIR